jgi:hypothetical protein
MNPFELQKQRELVFSDNPANQLDQAYLLLSGLENFHVERTVNSNSLLIRYSVQHYSLEGLEKALAKEGFQLQYTPLGRLVRQFIHYCEDVQYHNLKVPEHNTKSAHPEVFVKAYENHPHGDRDDTPKDMRDFK